MTSVPDTPSCDPGRSRQPGRSRDLAGTSFDAVIFDVDGTLVRSQAAIGRAWTTWLHEYGVTPDPSVNLHGMTTEAIVQLCLPEADADRLAAAVARILELEESDVDGVVAVPGAREALDAVPPERCALATSGTRPVALARLLAAGLPAPAVFVTADDITRSKPDPEIFRAAAERLGVRPDRCLVVEDAPAGVAAGRAAGAAVVAVLTTSRAEELAEADLIVPDLTHVRLLADADSVRIELSRQPDAG